MRAPTVIGISAAAHGVLFSGLAHIVMPHGAAPAKAKVPTPVSIEIGEPDPIAVVVLDEPAPTEIGLRAQFPLASRARTNEEIVLGAKLPGAQLPRTDEEIGVGPQLPAGKEMGGGPQLPEAGSGAGTGLMRMRTAPVLALGDETAERIPGAPYVAPVEPKVSGKLHTLPGGRAIVDDRVATFDVGKDGTVKITDKPDIDIHLKLPIPHIDVEEMREDLGKELTEWFKDPEAGKKFGRMADVSRVWKAVPGACDSWGDTWCDDELAPGTEKYAREQKRTDGSLLGGTADITAYAMRKLGIGDPYASRKLKLLAETRDERVAMGQRYRNEQLEKSAEIIENTLEQMWAREVDPARRRQALFELWDDCEEGAGARGEAGQRARAMVLGWIGAHLPKGSPGAYSDEEIRRLDGKRSSKQSFTPY